MTDDRNPYLDAATGAIPAAPTPYPTAPADRPSGIDAATGATSAGDTPAFGSTAGVAVLNADDFEVVRELGRGGMGVVKLARHRRSRKWFALKGLLPAFARDPHARRRFDQEAEVLFGLKHAHITVFFGQIPNPADPQLVLEYVDGPMPADPERWADWNPTWPNPPMDLEQLVRANGPLPFARVAELGVKLGSALTAAHDYGVMHRDVKPSNVLLARSGDPMLGDFGLARGIDPDQFRLTGSLDNMGTPLYAAPELLRDPRAAGAAADQYSLALTLYFAATGEDPTLLRPDGLPPRFYAWLTQATARDPQARFPDVAALTDALRGIRPVAMPTAPPPPPDPAKVKVVLAGPTIICPADGCGTLNPESDRRCRKCAAELWTTCLKCGADLAVDREACPHCAGIQSDERQRRRERIDAAVAYAQAARQTHTYDEAAERLVAAATPPHPSLDEDIKRANTLAYQLRAEQKKWRETADGLCRQQWQEYAYGRHFGTAAAFAQMPAPLWTGRMNQMARGETEAAGQMAAVLAVFGRLNGLWATQEAKAAEELADKRYHLFAKLREHAKRIPHHEMDDLHEKAEVTKVTLLFAHHADLRTLYETRKPVLSAKPDRAASARRVDAHTDDDPWGCELPVPEEVAAGTASHPVPGYSRLLACGTCQSAGDRVCSACKGAKQVACPTCRGAKAVTCGDCDGRGRREVKRTVRRFRDCGACRGTGRDYDRRCGRCDGTGRQAYEDTERTSEPCEKCMERGKLSCPKCQTVGTVGCGVCKGTGREACPECEGCKRLRQTASAQQTFRVSTARTDTVPHPDIPAVFAKRFRADDFRPVDGYTTPPGVSFVAVLSDPKRAAKFDRGLTDLVAKTPPPEADARIARQQLTVYRAEVAHVEYEYRGSTYECWLTADRDGFHADETPVTDDLRRTLKKAIKGGSQRELALAVADARDMARADDGCADVLDELKPSIDKDVFEWSKTVWTFEKRNLIWGGAGTIAGGLLLTIGLGIAGWFILMTILGVVSIGTGVFCIIYGNTKTRG